MNFSQLYFYVIKKAILPLIPLGKYRFARTLYSNQSKLLNGFSTTIPYLEPELKLKINLQSKNLIDHKILFMGYYEKDTNTILRKHLKTNQVVFEAGANSGTETILISRIVGDAGKVYAFEPVPHIREQLRKNCEINSIQNVSIHEEALGNTIGETKFYIASPDFTNQGMGSLKPVNQHLTTEINVKLNMLDNFVKTNNIEQIDFIKMDVQGAEKDIIDGAEETIKRFRPIIFLESSEGWSSILELFDSLNDKNYKCHLINEKGELSNLDRSNLIAGNWLAIPN